MAIFTVKEMVDNELNFGGTGEGVSHTSSVSGVTKTIFVDIGRISGHLAQSFGYAKVDEGTWAVQQVESIAPYAPDVFAYSFARWGMTPFDSVRRRTHDYLLKGAIEEWNYAWDQISQGKPYKYHPLYGE